MMKTLLLLLLTFMILVSPASAFITETIHSDWTFSSGLLNYGNLGDNHTYDYASMVDFHSGNSLDYGWNGDWFTDDFSWNHTLPNPVDGITTAKLYIDGAFIDNNNNEIALQGMWDFNSLNNSWWPIIDNDNTLIDLSNVSNPTDFWVNPFTVSIDYSDNTNWFGWSTEFGIRIDQSILMMDYNSSTGGTTSSVPEPTTLMLLGAGLAGLGIYRRKK